MILTIIFSLGQFLRNFFPFISAFVSPFISYLSIYLTFQPFNLVHQMKAPISLTLINCHSHYLIHLNLYIHYLNHYLRFLLQNLITLLQNFHRRLATFINLIDLLRPKPSMLHHAQIS